MDHVTPPHWPSDLTDAARNLSERLRLLQSNASDSNMHATVALKELSDLVGWVPEVAADTDLAESDWMKLYEASETLRKRLLAANRIERVAQEVEELCSLLIECQALIPPTALVEVSNVEQPSELEPTE